MLDNYWKRSKKGKPLFLILILSFGLAACGVEGSSANTDLPRDNIEFSEDNSDSSEDNTDSNDNSTPPAEIGQLRCPGQNIIDLAKSRSLVRFDRQLSGGAHSWWFHAGEMGMATTAACGDTQADARLVQQIRNVLVPGQGLTSPGGYADQHQVGMLATFAIVSRIPRLWEQFTPGEKLKMELMLEAALVSNAFLTSDKNPFVQGAGPQRAMDGDRNVNRDWNPNYRNGNLGSVIATTAHFGPIQADAILKTHSHQEFIEKLRVAGLLNLVETYEWSNDPTDSQIETTLHQDYSYYNISLDQVLELYITLTNVTYNKTVNCGLNNGNGIFDSSGNRGGYIAANCNQLPNFGKIGMLQEFNSVDGNGPRSAASYANQGLRPNTYIHYVLIYLGYWDQTPDSTETLSRIKTGADDLFFKLDPALGGGYYGYHKGKARGLKQYDDDYGHRISKELVEIVLDFHNQ